MTPQNHIKLWGQAILLILILNGCIALKDAERQREYEKERLYLDRIWGVDKIVKYSI